MKTECQKVIEKWRNMAFQAENEKEESYYNGLADRLEKHSKELNLSKSEKKNENNNSRISWDRQ